MRQRHRAGFTLIEVMLAAALLAGLVIIITDLFPDILRLNSQENLSYQVNLETQRILAQLKQDIQTAGFRILPPSTTDGNENPVNAIETPAANSLILRCISEVGELSAETKAGLQTLPVTGFTNLNSAEYLLWTYEGDSGCLRIVSAGTNSVTVASGLSRQLPAGTPLVAVKRIDYQIDVANFLVRRVNGAVTDRVEIDPSGTEFKYTVGTGTQDTLAPSDLDNLCFVNVSLRLVRTAAVPGGRSVRIQSSAAERIMPLNLKGLT